LTVPNGTRSLGFREKFFRIARDLLLALQEQGEIRALVEGVPEVEKEVELIPSLAWRRVVPRNDLDSPGVEQTRLEALALDEMSNVPRAKRFLRPDLHLRGPPVVT
jgi:hypothetical protein